MGNRDGTGGERPLSFRTGRRGLRPDRSTMVLIHGSGGSHLSWGGQIQPLDKWLNVLAVDLPGHGGAPGHPPASVPECAEWLAAELGRIRLSGRIFLAGVSLGGAVALEMVLREPQAFAGLIMIGSGARFKPAGGLLEALASDYDAALKVFAENLFAPGAPPEAVRQSYGLLKALPDGLLLADLRASLDFDRRPVLHQAALPALIVCGREDRVTPPELSVELAAGLPDARLEIVEKAGHMVMVEQYRAVNRLLIEFSADAG